MSVSVLRLHPEELLDKEARGSLNEAERVRLDAHFAECSTCRFERQLRADFAEEMAADVPLPDLTALLAGTGHLATPTPAGDAASKALAAKRAASAAKLTQGRSWRVRTAWMAAAAALMVGGVAAAKGLGAGEWLHKLVTPVVEVPSAPTVVESPKQALKHRGSIARTKPQDARVEDDLEENDDTLAEVNTAPPADATPVPPQIASAPLPVAEVVRSIAIAPRTAKAVVSEPIANVTAVAASLPKIEETSASLFDDANAARRRGDLDRVIAIHRDLEARFPSSRETQVSRATLGRWLLDRGDATGALTYFDAYLGAGSGDLAEDAMIGRATSLDRLGRNAEARRAWSALLDAFPQTPYAAHAKARLDSNPSEAR